ncbi:MAG: 50S ribosome-binding GTPase [Zavarzinella sp.]|nr:50S ribosome-binding GTPase [Zavarzinella sp.]
MTEDRVIVLTPPGSGAIAVLAVCGPRAWPAIRELFRPAGPKPVPAEAPSAGVWFGRLGAGGADEVILIAHAPDHFEIHCHGGRQVVAWILDLFHARGLEDAAPVLGPRPGFVDPAAAALIPFARTTRTAAILLDQAHGAYLRAVERIDAGGPDAEGLRGELRRRALLGRHLIEPWRVAIAGAPNAGKSSLVNALAGFARSVVSPTPGTTRDTVSVSVAFDGWPVDLFDTAGLRESPDPLEREGVDRAQATVAESDLVVWVVDATGPRPGSVAIVTDGLRVRGSRVIVVFNKVDRADVPAAEFREAARVSARTGGGVPELASRIAATLVPDPPGPGGPVPYTPALCARWA